MHTIHITESEKRKNLNTSVFDSKANNTSVETLSPDFIPIFSNAKEIFCFMKTAIVS